MSASPSRKRSTSNIGCSRKPSCSACRSRKSLAGPRRLMHRRRRRHRRARSPLRLLAKAPASCSPTSTREALDARGRGASPGDTARTPCVGVAARRHRRGGGRSAPSPTRSLAYGGLDIVVSNAGIASAAPIEDTRLALWQPQHRRPRRPAISSSRARPSALMKRQGMRRLDRLHRLEERPGGLARRLGLLRGQGGAKCISRAAWRSKARRYGIRVNTVNPDAVLRGSKIWQGEWREQRAAVQQGRASDELEEVYRQRSLLKLSVLPEDIAEAVYFFASDASAKSTGNILNVDAGNAQVVHALSRYRNAPRTSRAKRHDVPPYHDDFIAEQNRARLAALDEDYAALARQLARRGLDIEAIDARRDGLRRRRADLGRRHGRHALRALSRPRRAARHLRQARGLRRRSSSSAALTPTVSPHFPWDKVERLRRTARGGDERAASAFDAVNSNTFQDQPGQTLSYKFGSLTHTDKAVREQAIAHNIECIEIGRALGSKALTVWIGDGSNFAGQSNLTRAFDRYLELDARRSIAALPDDWRMLHRAQALRARLLFDRGLRLGHAASRPRSSSGRRRSAWSTSAITRRTSTSSRSSPGSPASASSAASTSTTANTATTISTPARSSRSGCSWSSTSWSTPSDAQAAELRPGLHDRPVAQRDRPDREPDAIGDRNRSAPTRRR